MQTINYEDIIFIDESGFDLNMEKECGWEMKGVRLIDEKLGNRANRERITIIAGLLNKRIVAPLRFEGYTNTETFNTWVEKNLIPELKPNHVIIMDNASFHKSQRTKELIESKGCILLYLPSYSPDFNPIEKMWGNMKKLYRNYKHKYENKYELIDLLLCNERVSMI